MTTPEKILLVDPDESDRILAGLVLKSQLPRAEVVQVGGFVDFLAQLDQGGFTAIVAEQRLGWTEGLRALQLVRRREPQVLLFLFTRHLPAQIATLAIEQDVSAYLAKSVSGFLELPRVIRAAVTRARRLRHLEVVTQAVDRLSIGILTLSREGVVRDASAAVPRLLGAVGEEEDLVGRSLESLVEGLAASPKWQALLQGERPIIEPFVYAAHAGRAPIRVAFWRARESVDRDEAFYGVVQKARENHPPAA